MDNLFKQLYETNVNDLIDKKGDFSYLSWPYAVAQLRLADPAASWEVKRFADDLPYQKTDLGVFVEVAVTAQGVTLSQIHPVLDHKNRPLLEPNAFDINTSIQRCLVKAIALHGLGLSIYAGEDLSHAQGNKVVGIGQGKRDNAQPATTLNKTQLAQVRKLITETGADQKKLLDFFQVEALEQIPATEYARVIRSLEKHKKEAA